MNSLKTMLGIALTMAINGCGLARVSNLIEVGEPLPEDLGLTEIVLEEGVVRPGLAEDSRIFGMAEYYVWHTPLTTSVHGVSVITDASDTVTACALNTFTVTNWLVALSVSVTHTIEIAIPPELMAEPKNATLGQLFPETLLEIHGLETESAATKAIIITSYGLPGSQVIMFFHGPTSGCLNTFPIANLPAVGCWRTILAHATGAVTITNLGNNRVRIDACTWYVTDPTGFTGFLAAMTMESLGLYARPEEPRPTAHRDVSTPSETEQP